MPKGLAFCILAVSFDDFMQTVCQVFVRTHCLSDM